MPASWVPIDLAAGGGAAWKGYTVKGPPGSTVKKSFDGPEISSGKDGKDYGLVVSFTATRLSNTKSDLREGVSYGTRPTFLTETSDLLEYSNESTDPKSTEPKTYGFHMLVKVGGTTLGCKSATSRFDRQGLEPLKEACKSLTKS
jgi:hypothetical protein